jgi:uncharacterized protein YqjF (DUF2071 family)
MFIHYEVDPEVLQREIPLVLDLWSGKAFVSLVAFTMRRFRPHFGGRLGELLLRAITNSRYLNVRTYVRHKSKTGIYFVAEFLSNPLCVPLGPPTFGLPYRCGRLSYSHDHEHGLIVGEVRSPRGREFLTYNAKPAPGCPFLPSGPGTFQNFLLERYTAFTGRSKRRYFRIRHAPWPQAAVEINLDNEGLLETTGRWINCARLAGAHYSPGVQNVEMGWPQRVHHPKPKRRLTVFFDV